MHRTGVEPLDSPHDLPVGTPISFDGKPYVVGVATTQRTEGADEDGFEAGTSAVEKARTLRQEAQELTARAQHVSAGPEREWALSRARHYLRRSAL
jgi:hypothetical protein